MSPCMNGANSRDIRPQGPSLSVALVATKCCNITVFDIKSLSWVSNDRKFMRLFAFTTRHQRSASNLPRRRAPAFTPATGARKVRSAAGRSKWRTDLTHAGVSVSHRDGGPAPSSPKTFICPLCSGTLRGKRSSDRAQHRASQCLPRNCAKVPPVPRRHTPLPGGDSELPTPQ